MLRKIERFDSGSPTGIVTLHEGKLYVAKALGDVDMLLKMTDAKEGRLTYRTELLYGRDVAWPSRDMYITKFKVD